ncbi:PLP-dependent cysteine synthase family protein [Natronobacterium gregoryi]|uniref:Cysteine synthase n=3 Tax=cellular organisms TaxID=131567 RepID=L0AFF2_NATGS|nr:PLP-dependent cysteine synthase family protein [Natronobacterium gregoryi]AFZ71877.1 cysteine synthase [Natronobacterium gregoryi SP2]ELY73052.1 pyridoxal-5'-phosphate-dependent protein subunit beta [Natronobacterium gregoryi SP2]PLK19394.1 cysteine synthase [Natronobacterium gregoryi SP2]SFJ51104.1 cystathionine beta-synthase (acetylserine-dependent) [Natronobacterium gregoryi]
MTSHDRPMESVLETIGQTPLVRIQDGVEDVRIYAKLESFNPGASVKDRIGRYMLERMLERGDVPAGGTVIEPTAGNTGIGLAIAAQQLGLDAIFVVPERFSQEKQQLMDALGAEIINTPTEDGMGGAIERAHELAEELDDAVVPQQFSNPLNAEAHYATTGPEIYETLDGEVGAVVAGCGTAGTLMGIARHALEQDDRTHVAAVEPEGSLYGEIVGEDRDEDEYKIEGIGTHDPSTNELFDPELVDDVYPVADRDAHDELVRLAREEGHLVASSAGAASVAAKRVARKIAIGDIETPHDTVVTIFPDSSERYLSKGIYRSFEEWSS